VHLLLAPAAPAPPAALLVALLLVLELLVAPVLISLSLTFPSKQHPPSPHLHKEEGHDTVRLAHELLHDLRWTVPDRALRGAVKVTCKDKPVHPVCAFLALLAGSNHQQVSYGKRRNQEDGAGLWTCWLLFLVPLVWTGP